VCRQAAAEAKQAGYCDSLRQIFNGYRHITLQNKEKLAYKSENLFKAVPLSRTKTAQLICCAVFCDFSEALFFKETDRF
jgi:hypothetical protein